MKKLIAGLSLAALLLAVLPAGAATISNVFDDSTAKIKYSLWASFGGTNTNEAMIQNELSSMANSGHNHNDSDEFQSNTSINTGDAGAATMIENQANEIVVNSNLNIDFGSDSDSINNVADNAYAKVSNYQKVSEGFDNVNAVVVSNYGAAKANTGYNSNESDEGLQHAGITSGSSVSTGAVLNQFNKISESFTRMIH